MISKHTRRAAKAAFAISLGVAILIGLAAVARSRRGPHTAPTIVIGTKNFPEEYILGQLYKQALEAKGFNVSYKENIGSTEIIQTALTSGKINFYPEYTGSSSRTSSTTVSPKTRHADLLAREEARGGEGSHGALPHAILRHRCRGGHERDGAEVRPEVDRHLKKAGEFKFGGFPECQTRNTCFLGYTKQYGVRMRNSSARRRLPVRGSRPRASSWRLTPGHPAPSTIPSRRCCQRSRASRPRRSSPSP